jgi:hypothetical protein
VQHTEHSSSAGCFSKLLALPAAAVLSSEQVGEALEAGIQNSAAVGCSRTHQIAGGAAAAGSCDALLLCLRTTAVQVASSKPAQGAQLEQLLEAAVKRESAACTRQLCKLPTATQLDSETLEDLLQTAQQHSTTTRAKCIAPLRGLLVKARKGQQTHL